MMLVSLQEGAVVVEPKEEEEEEEEAEEGPPLKMRSLRKKSLDKSKVRCYNF